MFVLWTPGRLNYSDSGGPDHRVPLHFKGVTSCEFFGCCGHRALLSVCISICLEVCGFIVRGIGFSLAFSWLDIACDSGLKFTLRGVNFLSWSLSLFLSLFRVLISEQFLFLNPGIQRRCESHAQVCAWLSRGSLPFSLDADGGCLKYKGKVKITGCPSL